MAVASRLPRAGGRLRAGRRAAAGEQLFAQLGAAEEVDLPELGVTGRIRFARVSPDGSRFVRLD